ncbi:DUF2214 domain-containing protein [Jiella avicenniae]|uniref:DUF2214 domain-containing protein n=1 Tax=Jiella avicenniae TaxID=2907202 RepID=A0A9X1P037_9HYPH|nr:DUF2214 domain-containing protein [Jiella avicenniae]MCE7027419.1 DUF2214 domain-containing protein [Jiella avicenniae]
MLEALLGAIAESSTAQALKASRILYPLVNAAHILAFATLYGSIVTLDLAVLTRARSDHLAPLARLVPVVAGAGLCVAIATGLILFSVQPFDYADNPAFRVKLLLVAVGLLHAGALHATHGFRAMKVTGAASAAVVLSAAVSLLIWTAAIVAGRFIAFMA